MSFDHETMADRMRRIDARIEKSRSDLLYRIEEMGRGRRVHDPDVEISMLDARQAMLELDIRYRRVLSLESMMDRELALLEAPGRPGGVDREALRRSRSCQRDVLMRAMMPPDERRQTVEEALKDGLDQREPDPLDAPFEPDMAAGGFSGVRVPIDGQDEASEVPSPPGSTLSTMARAGRHGAQVAAASAANKELVDLVKSLSGAHWPPLFDTTVGRSIAELLLPSVLLQLVNAYPDRIPQGELVATGCELAVEAVSRDAIGPLFHLLVPLTRKLAQAGSSLVSSDPSAARTAGELTGDGDDHEPAMELRHEHAEAEIR